MKYKKSKYILEVYDGEKGMILYNTKSNIILLVSRSDKDYINKILNEKQNENYNKIFRELEYKGFVIPAETDEDEELYDKIDRIDSILRLTIMPTENCNFGCNYCFEKHRNARFDDDQITRVVEAIKRIISNKTAVEINWYGGEPLLELETIITISNNVKEICKSRQIPYWANITTNGFFLDLETFEKLLKCNILRFVVTIDGPETAHNSTRFLKNGDGTYDRIIANLIEIKDNNNGHLWRISIRTNYTKDTLMYREEWENYLKQVFLKDNRFSYLPRYAWHNSNSSLSKDQFISFEFDDNLRLFDDMDSLHESDDKKRIHNKQKILAELKKYLNDLHAGAAFCAAGFRNSLIISPRNQLLKCQVIIGEKRNIIGCIENNGDLIFNSQKKVWENTKKEVCATCGLFPICMGIGCPSKLLMDNYKIIWCDQLKKELLSRISVIIDDIPSDNFTFV
ncbi:MAG: radical SAM protein [Clostridia bacterium]|nr:radical SAM protein [Clostridia bacterium]